MVSTPLRFLFVLSLIALAGCDSDPVASGVADPGGTVAPVARGDALAGGEAPSADELWGRISGRDSTVLVGLKAPGQSAWPVERGRVLLPRGQWRPLMRLVEALGVEVVRLDDVHPLVTARLTGPSQIRLLRRSPFVAYVESATFALDGFLASGCQSSSSPATPVEDGDPIGSGDILPYTLERHSVVDAWDLATGDGETVGVVDTGTSFYQPQLGTRFDDGASAGRTIGYDFSDPNTDATDDGLPAWHDTCGHGTKSIGLATAPLDGRSVVGVAYGADAYGVRAVDDVIEGYGQWLEIRDGIARAADNARIVNLAFGYSDGRNTVTEIIREYHDDHDVLFVGAAGTGHPTENVVYPAYLPEVTAVTGTTDGSTECDARGVFWKDCSVGPEVEFLAFTGGETTGLEEDDEPGFGGSSGATALTSGIAALVRSRYPTETRDQILTRMREATVHKLHGFPKDSDTGWGRVNARCAVGGICEVEVDPEATIITESGDYTFTADLLGNQISATYEWSVDGVPAGSGSSLTLHLAPEYDNEQYVGVEVTATDPATGHEVTDGVGVIVRASNNPGDCGSQISCS